MPRVRKKPAYQILDAFTTDVVLADCKEEQQPLWLDEMLRDMKWPRSVVRAVANCLGRRCLKRQGDFEDAKVQVFESEYRLCSWRILIMIPTTVTDISCLELLAEMDRNGFRTVLSEVLDSALDSVRRQRKRVPESASVIVEPLILEETAIGAA